VKDDLKSNDVIKSIKAKSDCRAIFKRFWPDHYHEQGNCACPFHEDGTPSLQVDKGSAFCHAEKRGWDALDLYQAGTGTDRAKAIDLLCDELDIEHGKKRTPLSDAAIEMLRSRGILKAVDRLREAGASSLDGNPSKGWRPSIYVPLTDWNGKTLGGQILPLDGGIKKFKKNTPEPKVFFHLPGTGPTIVTEGIYDALSVAEAIPGADVCAILSANATDKLAALQGREVVLFLDNTLIDEAGRKGTVKAESLLAGKCRLRSVPWHLAPEGIKDPNDLLKAGHADIILEMVNRADHVHSPETTDDKSDPITASTQEPRPKEDPFNGARSLFPRIPFPWEILPEKLSQSLQQLARACATSATPLPGTCFALMAAAMGRKYSVSPKLGWNEPLIVWIGDIRATGDGKTPAARILREKIEELQKKEHKRFEDDTEWFNGLSKEDKLTAIPPVPPRGYYLTGMTQEGLRDELHGHPTGGLVVIQDELSAFLSSQNQYRNGKGDDRETWLKLFDGYDARIGRAKQSILITGARPSLVGGIQPVIFGKAFTSEDGVYLSDGTIFRFLLTYDRSQHYPLTNEIWTEENREVWEPLLLRAFYWTEHYDPIQAIFDSQSQQRFFDWRNDLDAQKGEIPSILRGFIPKAVSYAVRLAGIIHCLHAFHQGGAPSKVLNLVDVERGIRAVEFYLGQIVDAMQLIEDEEHKPADERAMVLAQVLDGLREEVDSGRLSVSFVRDRFNSRVDAQRKFSEDKRSKAFGMFLRECGLNVSDGVHDANGQRAVKCLLWNEKTNSFIKDVLHLLHVQQTKTECGLKDAEDGKRCSASSAFSFPTDFNPGTLQNMQKTEKDVLHLQGKTESHFAEHAEHAEEVSIEKNENGLEFEGEI